MEIDNGKLKQLAQIILGYEEEKKSISDSIKETYAEAKAEGADPKALKKAVALLAVEKAEREALSEKVDAYLAVIEQ